MNELRELSQRFLRMHNRKYRRYFLNTLPFESRFSVLIGQRGVGKTTAISQYLVNEVDGDLFNPAVLYVQADHYLVKRRSLYDIAEEFVQHEGRIICFDEIHKYPDWSLELKSMYDTFPELKVIASGSSMLEIKKGTHDLSRRAIVYKMAGMSLREFVEMNTGISLPSYALADILQNHAKIAAELIRLLKNEEKMILPLFAKYIQRGYYPFYHEFENDLLFFMALEQNIHTTIESDILAIHPNLSGNSARKISKLLAALSQNVPYVPDMRKLRAMLELGDERTLKSYLKLLEDAGIISQLWKRGSDLRQLEKPEKIYMNNTALMHAICAQEVVNPGTIRETFFMSVLSHLHKVKYSGKGDFEVDNKYTFEIGGKSKDRRQIVNLKNAYLAADNIEGGAGNRIPLWLFGFLY